MWQGGMQSGVALTSILALQVCQHFVAIIQLPLDLPDEGLFLVFTLRHGCCAPWKAWLLSRSVWQCTVTHMHWPQERCRAEHALSTAPPRQRFLRHDPMAQPAAALSSALPTLHGIGWDCRVSLPVLGNGPVRHRHLPAAPAGAGQLVLVSSG